MEDVEEDIEEEGGRTEAISKHASRRKKRTKQTYYMQF